jgi:hypothetical protein
MRGKQANVGDTYISSNGYEYTKTKKGWILSHRLRAEAKLGRPLHKNERVTFADGDRTNLHPDNIVIRQTQNGKEDKLQKKKEQLRILKEEIRELEAELGV